MTTLSICLIIKNEENYLSRCLSSIKAIADEIIVIDTGSTDNSVEIASEFGAQVFYSEWANNFSSAVITLWTRPMANGYW
jgi:glycosyltransferase involved in cell wall biosynthesis